MSAINLNAADAMHRITLQVRLVGVSQLQARIWIGKQLIRLACAVIGCGVVFLSDQGEPHDA